MDEVNTTVETGAETPAVSQESPVSDAGLQHEMTGDFFTYDDGFGSFVRNDNAMPPTDKDGNPVNLRTKEDLDAFLAKTGQKKPDAQAQSAKPSVQQKTPEAISSAFEKNGKPDFKSIDDGISRFSKIAYQPRSLMTPSKEVAPAQPAVKLSPRETIKAEVEKIKTDFKTERLAPLEAMWAKCQAGGAQVNDAIYQAINEVYQAWNDKLNEAVEAKREELQEKIDKEKDEGSKYETISKESVRNYSDCANEFFPNSDPASRKTLLDQFLFGIQKDGKLVTKGYGADTINMLFDLAHEGKTFTNQQEVADAYDKWWTKFASVPQNIRQLTRSAFAEYQLQNHGKIRDGYRSQWDLEQQKKLNPSQAPASAKAGNVAGVDEGQNALDSFFAPPKPSM
jgi:hypothetical protein